MRGLLAIALLAGTTLGAAAEEAGLEQVPDLKGIWTGTFKTLIFGNNSHHPGSQTPADPPRVNQIEYTYEITNQDGRLIWGYTYSDPSQKEPLALAFSFDNGTILGADTDGYHRLTIISESRIETCYSHAGNGPSGSIVATCGILQKQPQ